MIAGVPYDAEVEYIASTTLGEYLMTGVMSNINLKIEISFGTESGSERQISGIIDVDSGSTGTDDIIISLYAAGGGLIYGMGNGYTVTDFPFSSFLGNFVATIDKDTFIISNDKGETATYIHAHGTAIDDSYEIPILAWNRAGQIIYKRSNTKVFYCKIWNGNTLIRSFIPVRVGSGANAVGCMYDRVTRKLFGNQGTGAFVIGPDVARPVMGLHFYPQKHSARDYVQDGLVGQFDAIENVAFGTHDTSVSEWVDILNPECKIPLGNGEYWGDDFLFSNKTKSVTSVDYNGMFVDWFGRCFKSDDASVLTAFTIEIGVKYDTYQFSAGNICQANKSGYPTIAFKDTWNNGSYQINGSNNNGEFYVRENTSVSMYVGDFIGQTNVVFALAWTFSNVAGEYAIYNNGVKQTVGSNSIVLTPSGNALKGYWTTNIGHTENCKYMWIRLSNKVLTAEEIAYNYSIDKARFNLP